MQQIPTPAEVRARHPVMETPKQKGKRIEGLQRGIAHWRAEIARTQAQIRSGAHPMYDNNCRKYIAECRGFINTLADQIEL